MKDMLSQFRDFAASKPADEEYDWVDGQECALGQFCKVMGWRGYAISYADAAGELHFYPEEMREAAYRSDGPYTFGALTERLNKALGA